MDSVRLLTVLALMVVSVVVFETLGLLIALPFIIGTVVLFLLSFTKLGGVSATRKIGRFTYNAIREEGLKRISSGTFHVKEESFTASVDKIKDVLSEQHYFPEFGIDGLFLSYNTEAAANRALEAVKSRGVKADIILDRRNWLVKIEFD